MHKGINIVANRISTVRSASIRGFEELVSELGGNSGDLLVGAGLAPDILVDEDRLFPSHQLNQLLELAARELNCESFGLQLSQKQELTILGPVALVVHQAATLAEGLRDLQRYLPIHSQAGKVESLLEGDMLTVRYIPQIPGGQSTRQLVDLTLGVAMKIFRLLSNNQWKPHRLYFTHRRPTEMRRYQSVFQAPLSFNQEFNGAIIHSSVLNTPINQGAAPLQKYVNDYLSTLELSYPESTEEQVMALMRRLLSTESCTQERIAGFMNVHPRVLQRRLKAANTSYQKLLVATRKDVARRYLEESSISITELSDILGYKEMSVFSRAFKKWYGVSPQNYTKKKV